METREIYSLKQGFAEIICTFCIISMEKLNLSVIRQNGESQSGGKKKQSTPNFPKNEDFLPPDFSPPPPFPTPKI